MNKTILNVIVAISNCASIIALVFIPQIPLMFRVFIAVIGVLCLCYLLCDAIKGSKNNETVCRSEKEIHDTMKNLVKTNGKICIMSRDLSWVDSEMEACVKDKSNDIKIFVEKESNLSKRLLSAGCEVLYYGHLEFEPKTRFTVTQYNRTNPQVAIANTQNTVRKNGKIKHIIYQTSENQSRQDKWINSLALDMIEMCSKILKGEENAKTSETKKD